jgi:signal peptidase I
MKAESKALPGTEGNEATGAASAPALKDKAVRSVPPTVLRRCLLMALMALASYFVFSHFLFQSVRVVGSSMFPTLRDSDYYFLNRWVYHFREPRRGEVVVIRDPVDEGFDIKRVIAGPGDLVYLNSGRVYVNGHELSEPYLPRGIRTYSYRKSDGKVIHCEKDEFFVLGDNRWNSADSRIFGPVPRSSVLGLVIH